MNKSNSIINIDLGVFEKYENIGAFLKLYILRHL